MFTYSFYINLITVSSAYAVYTKGQIKSSNVYTLEPCIIFKLNYLADANAFSITILKSSIPTVTEETKSASVT